MTMPEKVQAMVDTGSYVAVAVIAGMITIGGIVAGLFKVGQSKLPVSYLTAQNMTDMIRKALAEEMRPYLAEVQDMKERLAEGTRRMDEERERRYALELENQYRRGLEEGRKHD